MSVRDRKPTFGELIAAAAGEAEPVRATTREESAAACAAFRMPPAEVVRTAEGAEDYLIAGLAGVMNRPGRPGFVDWWAAQQKLAG